MKRLTLLLLLLTPFLAVAENYVPPKFPGGEARMDSFVKANLKIAEAYLSVAKNKYIVMTCNIDTLGRMTGIKVINSQILSTAQSDVSTESRRVLTLIGETYTWSPAEEDGEKVSVMQNITFLFDEQGAVTAKINSSLNKTIDREGNEIWVKHDAVTNEAERVIITDEEEEEKPVQENIDVEPQPEIETEKVEKVEEIVIIEDDVEEEETQIVEWAPVERAIPPPPPPRPGINSPDGPERTDEIFTIVDRMPEYPGGQAAMDAYVGRHFKMPEKALNSGAEGKIYIEFVVDVNGKMKDVKLLKDGVGDGCGEEALRVIKLMASEITWKPGEQRGEKVNVRYRYPVIIKNTSGSQGN